MKKVVDQLAEHHGNILDHHITIAIITTKPKDAILWSSCDAGAWGHLNLTPGHLTPDICQLSGVNCPGVKCPKSFVLESIVRSQKSWRQMSRVKCPGAVSYKQQTLPTIYAG